MRWINSVFAAYESSTLYKEKMKLYHDRRIEIREFTAGYMVLLFDSKLFPGKVRSRWRGPYTVVTVYPYDTIELENSNGLKFKVNGQRVKHYLVMYMRSR